MVANFLQQRATQERQQQQQQQQRQRMIHPSWQMLLANFSGVIYTLLVIAGVTILNLVYTCPAISSSTSANSNSTSSSYSNSSAEGDGCFWSYVFAGVCLTELAMNLALFHWFNRRNQISYWTIKSSSLLPTSIHHEHPNTSRLPNQASSTSLPLLGECSTNAVTPPSSATSAPSSSRMERREMAKDANHYQFPVNNLMLGEDGIYRTAMSAPEMNSDGGYGAMGSQPSSPHHAGPSGALIGDNGSSPTGTKWCVDCNQLTPKRCHHCPICGICVLRKDHHCFLTGGCVGLANQRYFIVFLFWAALGSAFGASYNFSYLNRFVRPWFPLGWYTYIGPVALVRWLFGYESSFFIVFLALMLSVSVASAIAAGGFFAAQCFYTLHGYTMHDYHVGRRRDHLEGDGEGWEERLALVFGRRWWVNFVLPQVWERNRMSAATARNIFMSLAKDL